MVFELLEAPSSCRLRTVDAVKLDAAVEGISRMLVKLFTSTRNKMTLTGMKRSRVDPSSFTSLVCGEKRWSDRSCLPCAPHERRLSLEMRSAIDAPLDSGRFAVPLSRRAQSLTDS